MRSTMHRLSKTPHSCHRDVRARVLGQLTVCRLWMQVDDPRLRQVGGVQVALRVRREHARGDVRARVLAQLHTRLEY